MDVHSPKNGINRYWSIVKSLWVKKQWQKSARCCFFGWTSWCWWSWWVFCWWCLSMSSSWPIFSWPRRTRLSKHPGTSDLVTLVRSTWWNIGSWFSYFNEEKHGKSRWFSCFACWFWEFLGLSPLIRLKQPGFFSDITQPLRNWFSRNGQMWWKWFCSSWWIHQTRLAFTMLSAPVAIFTNTVVDLWAWYRHLLLGKAGIVIRQRKKVSLDVEKMWRLWRWMWLKMLVMHFTARSQRFLAVYSWIIQIAWCHKENYLWINTGTFCKVFLFMRSESWLYQPSQGRRISHGWLSDTLFRHVLNEVGLFVFGVGAISEALKISGLFQSTVRWKLPT